jgi:hypothetical protein
MELRKGQIINNVEIKIKQHNKEGLLTFKKRKK